MTSAIDGTQISARNSSTGQLRSEWCRTQSPSGSRSLTCPVGRCWTGGVRARAGAFVLSPPPLDVLFLPRIPHPPPVPPGGPHALFSPSPPPPPPPPPPARQRAPP